jgi:hypothetical protein
MDNYVFISGIFVRETGLAVCLDEGDHNVWIPKSVIKDYDESIIYKKGDPVEFEIPEKLAQEKELI